MTFPAMSGRRTAIFSLLWFCSGAIASAQLPPPPPGQPREVLSPGAQPNAPVAQFDVEVELVTAPDRLGMVSSHEWGRVLSDMGIPFRSRMAVPGEEPEVNEFQAGRISKVKILAMIDARGNLIAPGHRFTPADQTGLTAYFNELRTYGAVGSPEGKPVWGLAPEQFETIRAALQPAVPQATLGVKLLDALEFMQAPGYPLRFSDRVVADLAAGTFEPVVSVELATMSCGTALAIALRENGLAFFPRRTPDRSIHLFVDRADTISNAWPIGWSIEDQGLQRLQVARGIFDMVPIEINDVPLDKVLASIQQQTQVPVVTDQLALRSKQIDPQTFLINYPARRVSWSLALKSIAIQSGLSQSLRVDEANHPFVWLTLFDPKQPRQ